MRFREPNDTEDVGVIVLAYSETGVGKTCSAFQSLPTPILAIGSEPRDLRRSVNACGRDLKMGGWKDFPKNIGDYNIMEYDNWEGFIEVLNQREVFLPFRSILLDGLTQLMLNLSFELEQQAWDAGEGSKGTKKKLIAETKLSQEGYGALANQMSRMVSRLGVLSQMGKYIVINSLAERKIGFSGDQQVYPSLMGKKFGEHLPGVCDLIGLVERNIDPKTNQIVFPPVIKFEPDGEKAHECKWSGPRVKLNGKDIPQHLPLDYSVILPVVKRGKEESAA